MHTEHIDESRYKYMMTLQRVYKVPMLLLHDRSIPVPRRTYLLKRWRDDRTQYLYEFFRDYDYISDREMDQLLRCVNRAKKQRLPH